LVGAALSHDCGSGGHGCVWQEDVDEELACRAQAGDATSVAWQRLPQRPTQEAVDGAVQTLQFLDVE
jgi:hypothetical protein